jgi:hypothetical protein
MRPHTRILYSLCDRITGEARGARQKNTGSNQAKGSPPHRASVRGGDPGSAGISRAEPGRALDWLVPMISTPTNRPEPRKSIGRRAAGAGTCRYFPVTSRAAIPNGTLTYPRTTGQRENGYRNVSSAPLSSGRAARFLRNTVVVLKYCARFRNWLASDASPPNSWSYHRSW